MKKLHPFIKNTQELLSVAKPRMSLPPLTRNNHTIQTDYNSPQKTNGSSSNDLFKSMSIVKPNYGLTSKTNNKNSQSSMLNVYDAMIMDDTLKFRQDQKQSVIKGKQQQKKMANMLRDQIDEKNNKERFKRRVEEMQDQ